jgi:hypothetical protein
MIESISAVSLATHDHFYRTVVRRPDRPHHPNV